jgi:hypothetical protein
MIDYMRIINDAKVSLMAEFERFEEKQHLDCADLDRMAAVRAQIAIIDSVCSALLHAENVELDRQYLAHRSGIAVAEAILGFDGEDSLKADFEASAKKPERFG